MCGIDLVSLFMSLVKGIGRKDKAKILSLMDQSADLSSMNRAILPDFACCFLKIDRSDILALADEASKVLDRCLSSGISLVSILSPSYPFLLKEIYDPPLLLFYRGTLPEHNSLSISIVGTRHATGAAMRAAFETGFCLSLAGINVVSGLALGIDAEAHLGCLLGRGHTIAVLGCGVDRIYPASNKRIAEKILLNGGAIASEYLPGTAPLKYHFPERNRIVSGLSSGTVIVEAPGNSGALITADYALDQGRDVFVHSAGIMSAMGAGTRMLADNGAPVFADSAALAEYYGFETANNYKIENRYFDNPGFIEDELEGRLVNHRGVLYRRLINA